MNDVGINKIEDGLGESGIGYVVVPSGVEDVSKFIEDCCRTLTLSIIPGFGYSTYNCVPCTIEAFQNIKFPKDSTEKGSSVTWIKDSLTGIPCVIGTLNKESDYLGIREEQFRISKSVGLNNVEVFLDGKKSVIGITILGDDMPADFTIKVGSKNKDSVLNISSDNELNILSDKNINIESALTSKISINKNTKERAFISLDEEKFTVQINDSDEKSKFNINYKEGTGFDYSDEFDNNVNIIKDKVTVSSKEVDLKADKIILANGKEKMVLGDTLKSLISDLIDAIMSITVTTPAGPSVPPLLNAAQFTVIKTKLTTILSNVSKTD